MKLHSEESLEKLEMCAEALEVGTAIFIAVEGLIGLEHKIIPDEKRMQVSLVYSQPEIEGRAVSAGTLNLLAGKLYTSIEQTKHELAKEGIEIETNIAQIDTLPVPG